MCEQLHNIKLLYYAVVHTFIILFKSDLHTSVLKTIDT